MKRSFTILTAAVLSLLLAAPAMAESWLNDAFGSLTGMKWPTALIVALLFALGIVLCRQKRAQWNARRISYAAMCIAISFVLT